MKVKLKSLPDQSYIYRAGKIVLVDGYTAGIVYKNGNGWRGSFGNTSFEAPTRSEVVDLLAGHHIAYQI